MAGARATTDLDLPARGDRRAREFAAGRRCASQALADAGANDVVVRVGAQRRPIWPAGFVGSITHTTNLAWAAVAPSRALRSLGIDSEPIFTREALGEVGPLALDEHERQLARRGDEAVLATLVFSAKESLFKCVNPCVGVFFEFADARVERITGSSNQGTFELCLRRSLATEFSSGRIFVGHYAIDRHHVHTAVELTS